MDDIDDDAGYNDSASTFLDTAHKASLPTVTVAALTSSVPTMLPSFNDSFQEKIEVLGGLLAASSFPHALNTDKGLGAGNIGFQVGVDAVGFAPMVGMSFASGPSLYASQPSLPTPSLYASLPGLPSCGTPSMYSESSPAAETSMTFQDENRRNDLRVRTFLKTVRVVENMKDKNAGGGGSTSTLTVIDANGARLNHAVKVQKVLVPATEGSGGAVLLQQCYSVLLLLRVLCFLRCILYAICSLSLSLLLSLCLSLSFYTCTGG